MTTNDTGFSSIGKQRFSVEEQNRAIRSWMERFTEFLCNKNIAYGGQALCPIRIASTAHPLAGIELRIDDKLNRIINGQAAGEDPWFDLGGYIVLREVGKELYNVGTGLPGLAPKDTALPMPIGEAFEIETDISVDQQFKSLEPQGTPGMIPDAKEAWNAFKRPQGGSSVPGIPSI